MYTCSERILRGKFWLVLRRSNAWNEEESQIFSCMKLEIRENLFSGLLLCPVQTLDVILTIQYKTFQLILQVVFQHIRVIIGPETDRDTFVM